MLAVWVVQKVTIIMFYLDLITAYRCLGQRELTGTALSRNSGAVLSFPSDSRMGCDWPPRLCGQVSMTEVTARSLQYCQ